MERKQYNIGLALSGGGVRGFAHIGALRALEDVGIKTDITSVDFEEGDTVAVVAGVWKDTIGVVQKMDMNKQTATLNVELFGRETPVEISFAEMRRMV